MVLATQPRRGPSGQYLAQRVATLGLVVLAFMIGAKLVIMGWPNEPLFYYVLDLATSECGDFLYTAAFCTIGWLLLYSIRRREWLRKFLWLGILGFAAANVVYAAINVVIMKSIFSPLTYSLLVLAGDAQHMRSSVLLLTSTKMLVVIGSIPIIFVGIVRIVERPNLLRNAKLAGSLIGFLMVYVAAEPMARAIRIDNAWGAASQVARSTR